MQLNNRVYNILKWLVMIALPAIATFYTALSGVWGWPLANEVTATINAVTAFLGVIIGISTVSYNKAN